MKPYDMKRWVATAIGLAISGTGCIQGQVGESDLSAVRLDASNVEGRFLIAEEDWRNAPSWAEITVDSVVNPGSEPVWLSIALLVGTPEAVVTEVHLADVSLFPVDSGGTFSFPTASVWQALAPEALNDAGEVHLVVRLGPGRDETPLESVQLRVRQPVWHTADPNSAH